MQYSLLNRLAKATMIGLAAFCLSQAVTAVAQATTLIDFPFLTDLLPSTVDPRIGSYDLSFASGTNPGGNPLINDSGFGPLLNFYPTAGSVSAAAALTNNAFFSLTLNAASTPLKLDSLSFFVGKGGDADPRGYFVRSSVDGFSNDLIGETLPAGVQQAPDLRTVDLTGANFQNVSTITFRFYGFTPDPNNNSVDFADLAVNAQAAPESNSLAMMGGVFFLAGAAYCRRKIRRSLQ